MLAHKIVLSFSLAFALSTSAQTQERIPCGVVTSSIKLTASCEGPMVIAADNITVDLGGYDVGSYENDALVMKDRSGVVIKNGSTGIEGAIRIQGGRNNRLQDLDIGDNYQGGPFIIDSQNTKLQRINFLVGTDAGGLVISGKGTTVSESTFRIYSDANYGGLQLKAGAIASRNTFFGGAQGSPLLSVEAGARAEYNTIEWWPEFIYPPGQSLLAALVVQGNGAVVRSNSIQISGMKEDSYSRIIGVRVDGSRTTVKGNAIIASAPEVASVGIFVSPQSKKNIIQKNRISGGDSPDDVGIYVLGSSSKIIGNNTDSVVDEGASNIVKRNVVAPLAEATAKR